MLELDAEVLNFSKCIDQMRHRLKFLLITHDAFDDVLRPIAPGFVTESVLNPVCFQVEPNAPRVLRGAVASGGGRVVPGPPDRSAENSFQKGAVAPFHQGRVSSEAPPR